MGRETIQCGLNLGERRITRQFKHHVDDVPVGLIHALATHLSVNGGRVYRSLVEITCDPGQFPHRLLRFTRNVEGKRDLATQQSVAGTGARLLAGGLIGAHSEGPVEGEVGHQQRNERAVRGTGVQHRTLRSGLEVMRVHVSDDQRNVGASSVGACVGTDLNPSVHETGLERLGKLPKEAALPVLRTRNLKELGTADADALKIESESLFAVDNLLAKALQARQRREAAGISDTVEAVQPRKAPPFDTKLVGKRLGGTRRGAAVSYTHLTLPTTPYV